MFMQPGDSKINLFWALFPFFSTIFCILLTMVPFGLSTGYLAPPSFALVAIFIWILINPALMPPLAVFALGVLQDLFWGGPVGLWGLVFLIAYAFTLSQRRLMAGRAFGLTWTVFGVVAIGCGFLAWCGASVFYATPMPVLPILSQTILTFAVYPLFFRMVPFFTRRIGEGEY